MHSYDIEKVPVYHMLKRQNSLYPTVNIHLKAREVLVLLYAAMTMALVTVKDAMRKQIKRLQFQ
jgi:hypothetical protein